MTTLIEEVEIGRRLPPPGLRREIRRAAGVTMERLAGELGVHPVTVARWEGGTREPRGSLRARYTLLLEQLQEAGR